LVAGEDNPSYCGKKELRDDWAILAWIREEPSAPRVDEILHQAEAGEIQLSMSWINAGEAYTYRSESMVRKRRKAFLPGYPRFRFISFYRMKKR